MSEHTPTPWQVGRFVDKPTYRHQTYAWKRHADFEERRTIRGLGVMGTPECNVVARANEKVDAEFIVLACNAHDALVAALQDAIECIHVFHGDAGWDIYEKNAPEKQRFYAALAQANTPAEVKS